VAFSLVELIVLNVGLQAGILDTRLFSMFVVHALVLTVMTTPLTLLFYPPALRTGRKGIQGTTTGGARSEEDLSSSIEENFKTKFSVVLNRIEHLPAIMTITQLLQPISKGLPTPMPRGVVSEKAELTRDITQEKQVPDESSTSTSDPIAYPRVSIEALRLIELTDRTSAVMRSSEADDLIHRDALITVFSTFGRLNRIPVATSLSIVSQDAFSTSVATHARDTGAQLVVVPWHSGNSNVLIEDQGSASPGMPETTTYNPFDGIFGKGSSPDRTSSVVYANFVRKVFSESPADVALFVDRGGTAARDQHIFLPFFGGPDDRLALRFVVQLCANPDITATVVRMRKTSGAALEPTESNDTDIPEKAREAINALTMQSVCISPRLDQVGTHVLIVLRRRVSPTRSMPLRILQLGWHQTRPTTFCGRALPIPTRPRPFLLRLRHKAHFHG
jgi:K+:H+ antiporter